MSKLTELENLLSECAKKLDGVTSLIKESELDSGENIKRIGAALTYIYEIQHAIYEIKPELKPDSIKVESPHPLHNKLLTTAMSNAASLCDVQQFEEAIIVMKEFLDTDPPKNLARMAESRIAEIESMQI
jgi:hypothetical protein